MGVSSDENANNPTSTTGVGNDDGTDDDKLYTKTTRSSVWKANTILATITLIPSILAGALLSVLLVRMIWRQKSTAFDSLVLALTLWQLLYDLMFLFDSSSVAFNIPKLLCRPHCGERVMRYRDGDDDSKSVDDGNDQTVNNYSRYDVTTQIFVFIQQVAYLASALESTVIVLAVLYIVYKETRPKFLRHPVVVHLIVFFASLLSPLVFLIWWFDGIPGKPPFLLKGSGYNVDNASQSFGNNLLKSVSAITCCFILVNIVGCCLVYSKVFGYRKQGVAIKGSALLELSRRLAFYPFVHFWTRIFDVIEQLNWNDRFSLVNIRTTNSDGKRVGSGSGHAISSPAFLAVDFLRGTLLGSSGLLLVLVYFRFSAKGAKEAVEFLEPVLSKLRRATSALSARLSSLSRSAHATAHRLSDIALDYIPRSQREGTPPAPATEAELAFRRSTKAVLAFVTGAGGSDKFDPEAEARARVRASARDVSTKDDDELLALLEGPDEEEPATSDINDNEINEEAGSQEAALELGGVYDRGNSMRISENPLHRLDPAS